MRVLICFALIAFGSPVALAQAPRPVLIEACNETPFGIGLAAAYRNDPSERHVVQGWFQIASGECLEGRLADIVGNEALIGVASGSWRWPSGTFDRQYCTPAQTFFGAARSTNCQNGEQLTAFQRVPIAAFRSGWGRIQIRFTCDDFGDDDAELCRQTPQGRDGLASPIRTLEVCNIWSEPAEIAVGAGQNFDHFEVMGWHQLAAGQCDIVYRGFPYNNEVWFAARGLNGRQSGNELDGTICVAEGAFTQSGGRASLINAAQCLSAVPASLPAQQVRFGEFVSHYQDYTPLD